MGSGERDLLQQQQQQQQQQQGKFLSKYIHDIAWITMKNAESHCLGGIW